MDADFRVDNHGSVCILWADSPEAKQWARQYLPEDAPQWGVDGYVIEPRYVSGVVRGFQADGLTI